MPMSSRVILVSFVSSAMLASAPAALAQSWGGPTPSEGACFYQDANYRGRYFCVDSDDDVSSMPSGSNDRISSIRVFGRAEVTVFADPRFRGQALDFSRSVSNLTDEDFNDEISSIQVRGRDGGNRPSYGRSSGGGGSRNAEAIVRRAYEDVLEREPDAAGMRTYRSRIIDDGWSEQQVRDALRRSPEYRTLNTMTRAKAEEIVAEAYQNVLKRDPDPGSRTYVDKVLRDKWTRQDVERELRKSPEYRDKR